jgi:hypothetical protein
VCIINRALTFCALKFRVREKGSVNFKMVVIWEAYIYLGFNAGECPHVPKILVMGQSNDSIGK